MNRLRAEVGVEISGELLKIRFTTNAVAEIEGLFADQPIWDIFNQTSMTVRRGLFWAGLRAGDPTRYATLTLSAAGDLMDQAEPFELKVGLEKAQLLFMGASEDDLKNLEAAMREEHAQELNLAQSIAGALTGTPGTPSA